MVLNYDNQKTIDILKYAKKLNFKERVLLAINILESNYIVVKDDAVLKELYRILGKVDEQYTKTNYINFFDYKHLLMVSAKISELPKSKQTIIANEIFYNIFKNVKNKIL